MINASKIRIILLWFAINSILASLLYLLFSVNPSMKSVNYFWETMITTHIVSYLCAGTSFFIAHKTKNKNIIKRQLMILTGSLIAAVSAVFISYFPSIKILKTANLDIYNYLSKKLIITMAISAVVTTITIIIIRLKETKNELQKNLDIIQENLNVKGSKTNSLSIKEDEIYHIIEHSDLIYLSSHGKKTTIHTIEKDFVTNQLLKDIEDKLPEKFIRIHKQFIVNIKYLSKIKYYEGGRYLAYLKDEDESTLPVSKKVVPILKEKLGI